MALPEARGMSTPLGEVMLDVRGVEIATQQGVGWSAAAHDKEHALEVQLPFLQRVLSDFTLIPVVVGRALADDVARVIDALADEETLVVVSSDLSHYLPWSAARDVDEQTAEQILAYDFEGLEGDQACGAEPLRGLLLWARNKGLKPRQLDLRNSGDTAGDKSRVVGYGAFAFEERQ
jgi:AmmeMemoRadiSam system protein B